MARFLFSCLLAVFLMPRLFAQDAPLPVIDGYVSQLTSQTSFAVDSRLVEVSEKTNRDCYNPGRYRPAGGVHALAISDHVLVFGRYEGHKNLVRASAVCKVEWGDEKVSGEGVVEAIDGQRLLVDGRLLEVTPASVVKPIAPRTSLAGVQVNDWIHYSATLQSSGRYQVQSITLEQNLVSPFEDKLHATKFVEFIRPDLAAKRDGSIKFAHLARRYRLPANEQIERLTRLGRQLIPAYQKSLAPDNPVRIDFHFYPIDRLKLSACLSTAQGVIFVPSTILERFPQDSDLAPILATCVADLIERQDVRIARLAQIKLGASAAEVTGVLFVPGLGPAAAIGSSVYADHLEREMQEQSARVSLDLLAAAGYAPDSAPHVWEVAESKHLPPKMQAQPNSRVSYLYRALAERQRREP
jgi:hypothetical protein